MAAEFDDWSHTENAIDRRAVKAKVMARYCWDRGLGADDLETLDAKTLVALARAAEVNPPSSDETWAVVRDLLRQMDDWAAGHAGDTRAVRSNPSERRRWIRPEIPAPRHSSHLGRPEQA